jgi:glycerol-3-phosphate dehydrogenase
MNTPARPDPVDLLIIGGGINGAGIACDAAGRGLSVMLCEMDDLASATSSASSKLIHGGLRYLEFYEFRLVREALAEREVMLTKAPHIVWPLRFVLPHVNAVRPAWMIRIGLFLYDHLSTQRRLPGCRGVDLRVDPYGAPLADTITKGFVYSDCWVDDARLVVLNAMDAAAHGATILTRTRVTGARRADGLWQVRLRDQETGGERDVRARVLVNAGGPWVQEVLDGIVEGAGGGAGNHIRLVKGSHIVVPRLYDGDHAYILQNTDRRVVFVIPYEEEFSLIGTTEVGIIGDPGAARMDDAEAAYLCDAVSAYFTRAVSPADIVWSFAGVRPLFDDEAESATAVTREYVLDLDVAEGQAPLLSVFGGKITTYRCLAEQALAKLRAYLPPMGQPWTADRPLPGGYIPDADFAAFTEALAAAHPGLDAGYLRALARRHGTLCRDVLGDARQAVDLGADFGAGLTAREVDYLMDHEWARRANDVLWRRTKCGLHMTDGQRQAVADYVDSRRSG